jgi:hypothetical protein
MADVVESVTKFIEVLRAGKGGGEGGGSSKGVA